MHLKQPMDTKSLSYDIKLQQSTFLKSQNKQQQLDLHIYIHFGEVVNQWGTIIVVKPISHDHCHPWISPSKQTIVGFLIFMLHPFVMYKLGTRYNNEMEIIIIIIIVEMIIP